MLPRMRSRISRPLIQHELHGVPIPRSAARLSVRLLLRALVLGVLAASSLGAEPASTPESASESASSESASKSDAAERRDESAAGLRLISLNPSLTAIVLRLGGRERLVGIDDYSARVVEGVAQLPRVGGLFDPSLESIAALRPDRVLLVAGVDQRSHAAQLERLGLEVEIYENERLSEVLGNIERVGRLIGREEAAAARVRAIRAMVDAVAEATAGRAEPRTLAVVDRSPLYLVGGETFLDEMLAAVGARNIARALGAGYPRGSIEWLIESRPELLIDMTPTTGESDSGAVFWSRWPSLPAVASGRVLTLDARRISLPGPDLDRALLELAVAVHGESIAGAIDAALARQRDAVPSAPRSAPTSADPSADSSADRSTGSSGGQPTGLGASDP